MSSNHSELRRSALLTPTCRFLSLRAVTRGAEVTVLDSRPPTRCCPSRLDNLQNFLLAAPVLLFSMVAHEYAHGYAALRQGDPTAYQLGRLTWNPIRHIDPFLTILMPVMLYWASNGSFIFGGAKPVPVQPRNYRNYRRGDIIVSLAGIATNILLWPVCAVMIVGLGLLGRLLPPAVDTLSLLQLMMVQGVLFNLVLAVFNLLPIPPLDGSHVMKYLLPPAWAIRYQLLGRYGILILLVLLWTDIGKPLFMAWMKPVTVLGGSTMQFVFPYFLKSPYAMGIG